MSKEIIEIREITEDSIVAYEEYIKKAMIESAEINFPGTIFDHQKRFCDMRSYLQAGSARILVALQGDSFAGYCWFFIKNEKRIHINEIAVSHQYRGMHIGSMLMEHTESYAIQHGIEEVELFCIESNVQAFKFYTARNFYTEKRLMVKSVI